MHIKKYTLLIVMFFALTSNVLAFGKNTAIPDRVKFAKQEFQKLVLEKPHKEIQATIYFIEQIALSEVQKSLNNRRFDVTGFKHGTQYGSGGYNLPSNESLENAFSNYSRDHLAFLKIRLKISENIIADNKDDEVFLSVISDHQKKTQYIIDDISKNGLRIVGIDVKGKVLILNDFMSEHAFVRLVEERQRGDKKPVIIPNQTQLGVLK